MTAPCRLDLPRPPRSQECIEAWIVFRVSQLRELAAWTACEYGRQRGGGDANGGGKKNDILSRALRQERQARDRGTAGGP